MIGIGICFVRTASPQCTNQCAEVPILTAQEQMQNSTFEHHRIPLPREPEIEDLTKEAIEVLQGSRCKDGEGLVDGESGQRLFVCPSTFHPCKYSFDLSPEAIVSANQGLFQAPLSLFWQGADIYSVTSVGNIVKWEKATVESSYNISSWDTAANSTFGYFVLYKHKLSNEIKNNVNVLCRLDPVLSLSQDRLESAIKSLNNAILSYKHLVDNQTVHSHIDLVDVYDNMNNTDEINQSNLSNQSNNVLDENMQDQNSRKNRVKRSFFTKVYSFLFDNSDELFDQIQKDMRTVQNNFESMIEEEHRDFNSLLELDLGLRSALNQLKIKENAQHFLDLLRNHESEIVYRLDTFIERVRLVENNIKDTVFLIKHLLNAQRNNKKYFCLSNSIVSGCFLSKESRIILKTPYFLDLKAITLELEKKHYISCDIGLDPSKTVLYNNQVTSYQSYKILSNSNNCNLKRSVKTSDFFLETSTVKINVLISEKSFRFSCYPTMNISVNGEFFLCNRTSISNPAFDKIKSIQINNREYLQDHLTTYSFLASALYNTGEEEHLLEPNLVKDTGFSFMTTPLKKLGKALNLHHSVLMKVFIYSLLTILVLLILSLITMAGYCVWKFTQLQVWCLGWLASLCCCKNKQAVPTESEEDQELVSLAAGSDSSGATAPPPAYPGSAVEISMVESGKPFPPPPRNDSENRMYNLL